MLMLSLFWSVLLVLSRNSYWSLSGGGGRLLKGMGGRLLGLGQVGNGSRSKSCGGSLSWSCTGRSGSWRVGYSAALDFTIFIGYLRKRLAYCGFQFLERENQAQKMVKIYKHIETVPMSTYSFLAHIHEKSLVVLILWRTNTWNITHHSLTVNTVIDRS